MGSIERRKEDVLETLLDALNVSPAARDEYQVAMRNTIINLIYEKRVTRNILDRIEEVALAIDSYFGAVESGEIE